MKVSKFFIATVISLMSLLTMGTSASAATKPYCTVASNSGYQWWVWTTSSVQNACYIAFTKTLGAGHAANWYWRGSYSTTARNKGTLKCKQGSRTVLGTGTAVFENALNMKNQLGWSGCYLKSVTF